MTLGLQDGICIYYIIHTIIVTFLNNTTKRREQIGLSAIVLPFFNIYSQVKHYVDHELW